MNNLKRLLWIFLIVGINLQAQDHDSPNTNLTAIDYDIYHHRIQNIMLHDRQLKAVKIKDLMIDHSSQTIIHFWASWCVVCLEELPEMIKLHDQKIIDDLILISLDDNHEMMKKGLARANIEHIQSYLLDEYAQFEALDLLFVPLIILLNHDQQTIFYTTTTAGLVAAVQ